MVKFMEIGVFYSTIISNRFPAELEPKTNRKIILFTFTEFLPEAKGLTGTRLSVFVELALKEVMGN